MAGKPIGEERAIIQNVGQLTALVAGVLAHRSAIEELDEACARLGERVDESDQALFTLWGGLELRLAEWTNGDLDEAELRAEFAKLIDPDLAPDLDPA